MNPRCWRILLLAVLCCGGTMPAGADNRNNAVYGLVSETYEGGKYYASNPSDSDGVFMGLWPGIDATELSSIQISTDVTHDGSNAVQIRVKPGFNGGAWVQFGGYGRDLLPGETNPAPVPTDMSAYAGGTIDFWLKTTWEGTVKIEWRSSSSIDWVLSSEKLFNAQLGVPLDGQWHHVSVPLSSFGSLGLDNNLSRVDKPAGFHAQWYQYTPPAVDRIFQIDGVVWKKASAGSVSLALKNRVDGTPATQLSWSGIIPGSTTWKAADQYIEVRNDYYEPGWGIQVYTDNTADWAVPRISTSTLRPAGLVGYSTTTLQANGTMVPMCWRVTDVSTTTLSIRRGTAQLPDRLWEATLGSEYPCFLWMMDRATPDFVDGFDYATAWDRRGIQHGEATWGGAISPNFLYVAADFSSAISPSGYKTSTLTVETFRE